MNNCDVTGREELINYSVLPKKATIKGGCVFANKFDETNLFPIGNGAIQDPSLLPNSSWYFDNEDVAGNAIASFVQPVNASSDVFHYEIPIDPTLKYKLSYWVKCQKDMTSYLSAAYYYLADGTCLSHAATMYLPNTKTTLAADLVEGDTQMIVANSAN